MSSDNDIQIALLVQVSKDQNERIDRLVDILEGKPPEAGLVTRVLMNKEAIRRLWCGFIMLVGFIGAIKLFT